MAGEKIGFLLFGFGFLILTRILYVKRSWYSRTTTSFMFFYRDDVRRQRKAAQVEAMYRVLLGYVFPIFTVIWLIVVAVQ